MKYTSLRVREDRKLAMERAAIDISYKIGKPLKWTDLAVILFDNYLDDAKEDLISGKRMKNKK